LLQLCSMLRVEAKQRVQVAGGKGSLFHVCVCL
jgi:hypothetical protein